MIFFFHPIVDDNLLLTLAHQKYKSGNYKQALDLTNSLYERNPRRTDNLLLLGAIYYQVICFFFWLNMKDSTCLAFLLLFGYLEAISSQFVSVLVLAA